MNRNTYLELKHKLSLMDPDYLVDVLEISSWELIDMFPNKFLKHIREEYGDEIYNEEGTFHGSDS